VCLLSDVRTVIAGSAAQASSHDPRFGSIIVNNQRINYPAM
jgi:hypothetical protein